MNTERITEQNKERLINSIFTNYTNSEDFTFDDYSRLKLLSKISKLEKLKVIEKLSEYKDVVIDTDEKPSFNFIRQEKKCSINEYIPMTNYGSKKRSKRFSTLFQKGLNLNLFTENPRKKIKLSVGNILPNNFDEISEEIEIKKKDNNYNLDRYSLNIPENKNILNDEEFLNFSKRAGNSRLLTSRNPISTHEKSFTETSLNFNKKNEGTDNKVMRLTQSDHRETKLIFQKIPNLKKLSRNINSFNTSNATTSFKSYSSSQHKPRMSSMFKKIEGKILNNESLFLSVNNNNIKHFNHKENKSGFKTSKQLIDRIINDGFVIDKYIKSNRSKSRIAKENKDKEPVLLKKQEKKKQSNTKKPRLENKKKDLTDEEVFCKKLSLVPGFAKQFFRNIYNRILFENRVLNKTESHDIKSAVDKLERRKRLIKQLKKDTIQRMRIAQDNIITENDDKIIFDEDKKFLDLYGNFEGLAWLIKKKNIIKYGKIYH